MTAYSRIFLLSHMRAYTSLLGHILGSHPQINGYYEMHLSYASADDLARQVQLYAQQDTLKPGSRFLFDKLLHNDYVLERDALHLQGETVLLALRRPEPTLKSIINLFAQKNTHEPYANPAEATQYYVERLQALAEFSRQYPQGYQYFDAELIRTDTETTLATLSQWLELDSPLSAHYQRFAKTGVAGAGDTSVAISSGKVISEANHYAITVDAELLQQATQSYEACRLLLMQNAKGFLLPG